MLIQIASVVNGSAAAVLTFVLLALVWNCTMDESVLGAGIAGFLLYAMTRRVGNGVDVSVGLTGGFVVGLIIGLLTDAVIGCAVGIAAYFVVGRFAFGLEYFRGFVRSLN